MARYKYKHNDVEVFEPRVNKGGILVISALAIGIFIFAKGWQPFNIGLFLVLLIGGIALSFSLFVRTKQREIEIKDRYFICGRTCVHFGNIKLIQLRPDKGRMRIIYTIGTVGERAFVLDRRKFPTDARKPHKIALNTQKKFDKISQILMDRAYNANPEVEIVDLSEQTAQQNPARQHRGLIG